MIPGGLINPDQLRSTNEALEFTRHFFESGKPVAAICHGPWVLIDAGVVRGRTVTSWPAIKTDLRNAGANWVDKEVVVDNGLVTSRKPDDIPAFNKKMIEEFGEGKHSPATAAFASGGTGNLILPAPVRAWRRPKSLQVPDDANTVAVRGKILASLAGSLSSFAVPLFA